MRLILLLLVASPAFADGSDWIIVRREPVRVVTTYTASEWILQRDGSYVRTLTPRRTAPAPTTFATPQTVTQAVTIWPVTTARSVPQVPFTLGTTAPVAVVPSIAYPAAMPTAVIYTPAPRAARRGGISFGVSAGACVGGG